MGSAGCMVLFMLPFAAVGLFTGMQALRAALVHDWKQAVIFGFFALTFGAVGFGGIAGTIVAKRRMAAQQALRDSRPESPWLWRPDWAGGRVEDGSRTTTSFAWAFAIFWNLISLPAAFIGVRETWERGNHAALFALLFPVIGIGLLTWAVRSTLRYRRYGVSRLDLTTVPGVVGHSLAGTVRIAEALRPEGGFHLTLTSLRRRTTGSGKHRSTSEAILWQEDRRVPGTGTSIPVAFAIPADAEPCDDSDPDDRVVWRLEVDAEVPGIDYHSVFEVPVFRTETSTRPRSPEEEATRDPSSPAAYRQPATSRIQVTSNRRGTEILYPAARNPGAAAALTLFFVAWCGVTWATIRYDAPIIFPIVFGLFGTLLLWGVLEAWLRVTRVTVEAGSVSIASGYLVPAGERTISGGEIADVTPRITMQGGRTPYYDVTIVRHTGKPVSAGGGVRDKREAEWLARTIKDGVSAGRSS